MNLVLYDKAKKLCEKSQQRVITVMLKVINQSTDIVKGRLNGALYSLLSYCTFRKCAIELGVLSVMKSIIKSSTDEVRSQVKCITERLGDSTSIDIVEFDNDNEELPELSDIEEQTDEEDSISNPLLEKFIANTKVASSQIRSIKRQMESVNAESKLHELLPRTPINPDKIAMAMKENKRISKKVIDAKKREIIESEIKRQVVIETLATSQDGNVINESVFARRDRIGRTPPIKLNEYIRSVQI